MAQLIRFSEQVTIAIHGLMHLAVIGTGRLANLKAITDAYPMSEAHLSKVMQRLGRAGLVRAVRGPQGGYALAGAPDEITLLQVYEAIEGRVTVSACLLGQPICANGSCGLGTFVCDLQVRLRDFLAGTTLANLTADSR